MYSGASVDYALDTKHKGEDERILKIRITYDGQPRLYSIGAIYRLTKKEFKNKRSERAIRAFDVAGKALLIAKGVLDELGTNFTFDSFHEKYKRKLTGRTDTINSFAALLSEYFEKHECKYKTRKSYETSVNWVIRYKPKATLSSISSEFVEGLISFMRSVHQQEHNSEMSENTIRMYLRQLRAIYNFAISKGYTNNQENPFAIKNLESIERQNAALSWEEMSQLIEYTPTNKTEEFGKDFFLLSFYCNGANLGDILLFKNSNIENGLIVFMRRKTRSRKAKPISIKLTDSIKKLLNKYGRISEEKPDALILPYLEGFTSEKNLENRIKRVIRKANAGLKSICETLGLRKITTYNARHTTATALRDENMTAEQIQKVLGHNNVTTTQIYLDSLSINTLEAIGNILENFGKKV